MATIFVVYFICGLQGQIRRNHSPNIHDKAQAAACRRQYISGLVIAPKKRAS